MFPTILHSGYSLHADPPDKPLFQIKNLTTGELAPTFYICLGDHLNLEWEEELWFTTIEARASHTETSRLGSLGKGF